MRNTRPIILCTLVLFACSNVDRTDRQNAQADETVPKSKPKVAIAKIEEGIKAYIASTTEKADGYFHVKDDRHQLKLKLVRVHTEYLSNLGPQRYFACVDLADISGDVYDVDFFMEGHPDSMRITETTVHKLNGKPYYTWKQDEDKTWKRVPVAQAANNLLGVIEDEDEFEFTYHISLPQIDQPAKMWIPVASSDAFQQVELFERNVPGKQQIIKDKEYGNNILYLELGPEHSKQEIEIVYKVKRKEKGPYEEPNTVPQNYLGANLLMPLGGRFSEIVEEAVGEKRRDSKLMQARALYDYIIDNMRYMKFGDYGRGDALYACDTKTGNCTEFHSFFISLARTAGIPARFAIGASIPSDRNEGGIDGYHCWAEFYAEGKWWPVDISEGNKYTALATYYFGRHPANRIELSRGRDLLMEPGPMGGPVNFMAYPILETGNEKAVVQTTFSFERKPKHEL